MAIPLRVGPVGGLNETDSRFREAAGEKTTEAKVLCDWLVEPVELLCGVALALDTHELRRLGLHLEGEFEGLDSAFESQVRPVLTELLALPLLQQVELHPLICGRQALILEKVDRGLDRLHARGPDGRAVVGSREEGGGAVLNATVLVRRTNGHETGEVLALGSQTVSHPGTHGRLNEAIASGVHCQDGSAVRCVGSPHGTNEAEVVDNLRDVGQQLAHPGAGLTVLLEIPGTLEQIAGLVELNPRLVEGQRFVVVTDQKRFVREQVVL